MIRVLLTRLPLTLTHRQRQMIVRLHGRHGRGKCGRFLCEGYRCCLEALRRRPEWIELVVLSSRFAVSPNAAVIRAASRHLPASPSLVTEAEFEHLAVTEQPQGVLCVGVHPDLDAGAGEETPPADPFVLVLDRLAEPGNLGTILRTAWAVGLKQAWLTQGTADPYSPKAIRAGMGAQFALELRTATSLRRIHENLAAAGYPRLWCAVPRGGVDCFSAEFVYPGSAVVIGNEATGITEPGLGQGVSIPMPGDAESLNAAQAGTILLFEAVRRGVLTAHARTA